MNETKRKPQFGFVPSRSGSVDQESEGNPSFVKRRESA